MVSFALLTPTDVSEIFKRQRTALSKDIASGLLVPPIKCGPRKNMWASYEIEEVARARLAGWSDDQLRELAKKHQEQRKHFVPGFSVLAAPQRTSAFDVAGQALFAGA